MKLTIDLHLCLYLCILPSPLLLPSSFPMPPHTFPLPPAVSGAAQIIGDLVTGRVAETTGQAFNIPYDEGDGAGKFQYLSEVLRWRSQTQPDNQLFTLVDTRVRGNGGCDIILIQLRT